MRIFVVLALLLTACGSTLSAGVAGPSPSATAVPWLAANTFPTLTPTPTPIPRPLGIPSCRAADVAGVFIGRQGATGWMTRSFAIGNRGPAPCIVDGPIGATYVDTGGQPIVGTTDASARRNASWAVLGPRSAPSGADDRLDGEAMFGLATYGDCGPAPALGSVTITFAPPTGDVRIPMESAIVGGRCDVPGMALGLGIFSPLAPAWWSHQPERTAAPVPLGLALDAPAVAFAGETLAYVVRVRNSSTTPFGWSDGCPIYLEWLAGRDVSPTNVPGHIVKPLEPVYAGTAKEHHTLNCAAAGTIQAGGGLAFDMRIDLPRDALGFENLCWAMLPPPETTQVCTPIQFLPPRQ